MNFSAMQNTLNELAQGAKIIDFEVERGECTIKFKHRRGPVKTLTFFTDYPFGYPDLPKSPIGKGMAILGVKWSK